jgi:hypothetical protein
LARDLGEDQEKEYPSRRNIINKEPRNSELLHRHLLGASSRTMGCSIVIEAKNVSSGLKKAQRDIKEE